MSTVVGFVNKNGVWIGADDSASSDSGERRPIIVKKVFRNGKYLFGCTGSIRASQLLFPEYFTPPSNIVNLVDDIRNLFREKGCITLTSEDQTQSHLANFLVGYKKKLYEILVDFQINQVAEYDAIGSGSSFAFGALYTIRNTNLKPEQRIKIALQAAEKFDTSTASPFMIVKL